MNIVVKETAPHCDTDRSISKASMSVNKDQSGHLKTSNRQIKRASHIELPLLSIIVGIGLFYAWLQSGEGHLSAENGPGYYLGIIGSVAMLALLLYPLRKRMRALRIIGGVRSWFRIHMLLGIVGPALIVLHSNFSTGSLNSTVALVSMLIVAGSGFVGRFLYGRIHRGLYGRKAQVHEFMKDAGSNKAAIFLDLPASNRVVEILREYEGRRLSAMNSLASGTWRVLTSGIQCELVRRKVMKEARKILNHQAEQTGLSKSDCKTQITNYRHHLDQYFSAIARTEVFIWYERLFSLWHMLHLPLFIILVVAALTHVLAVHLY